MSILVILSILIVGPVCYFGGLISSLIVSILVGIFWVLAAFDMFQNKRAIRKNFPVIGRLRYLFEAIRPELQQYFIESNLSGRPIPRELRSVVYQRAKGQLQTQPFGTQRDVEKEGHEWVRHSMLPVTVEAEDLVTLVGSHDCDKKVQTSLMNISAMSYGSLSWAAVKALNLGAKKGRFLHNTGEGGVSEHHLQGGNLIWQIGTGYFGARKPDGTFGREMYKANALRPEVKMIELKLSQGAKPGKGGMLPASKVTKEIAEIRGVPIGEDVISPSGHSAFGTPVELLHFIQELRDLSGGKPVGFKLCVGRHEEFVSICKAIIQEQIYPDFISVDGAEGGTGAAPLEFANSVGTPLDEGLAFVVNCLNGFGIKDQISVFSSGKILTAFHLLTKLSLGADAIMSARGMMLALGCIQAVKCNTNHCPVGVATTKEKYIKGLVVTDKSERVRRYHYETLHALAEIVGAMGYHHPMEVMREDVSRRLGDDKVRSYEELFPSMPVGGLIDPDHQIHLNSFWKTVLEKASTNKF